VNVLHGQHRKVAEVLAIEAASQALLVFECWVVLTGLGSSSLGWTPLVIEGGVKVIGLVFAFVPGQVGGAEGVYAFLATVTGLSATAGLTLALVRRVRGLLVGALGLAVFSDVRLKVRR